MTTQPALKTVAILSPGEMGAAIGNVLRAGGFDVVTCVEGRSELTRSRASEAGFRLLASLDDVVQAAGLVVSVLVPGEAMGVAEAVAAAIRRTGARPAFADCNAIAPQTVEAMAHTITSAGAGFIDAGIIGGPPRLDRPGATHFCCSGPDTAPFEALTTAGLSIRRVGDGVGQASGLKMLYAASTKGTTGLWTELMTAARALGLEEALRGELGDSVRPANAIPGMPRRARRWVSEMEEIAATFAGIGLTPRIFEGMADIYRLVGDTPLGDQTSRDPDPSLDHVLDVLAGHLAPLRTVATDGAGTDR